MGLGFFGVEKSRSFHIYIGMILFNLDLSFHCFVFGFSPIRIHVFQKKKKPNILSVFFFFVFKSKKTVFKIVPNIRIFNGSSWTAQRNDTRGSIHGSCSNGFDGPKN